MTEHFGQFLKKKLVSMKRATQDSFFGCSSEEIATMSKAQGVECLPRIYIEFMEAMGQGAGGAILRGEDFKYKWVIILKQEAQECVNESVQYNPEQIFRLPDDAFVFYGHHGIQYCYFHTTDCNDDPPVFTWMEGEKYAKKIYNCLSEFYLDMLK
jgi:hypothetical protein